MIQLEVGLFNESNADVIFGLKTAFLMADILFGFAVIQTFHYSHILSAANAIGMVNTMCVFLVTYDKGFSVPTLVKQLKSSLKTKIRTSPFAKIRGRATKRMLQQVESVGSVAIRVGHFHYLQRTSTFSYMDFCFKNSFRLVIAYRKSCSG